MHWPRIRGLAASAEGYRNGDQHRSTGPEAREGLYSRSRQKHWRVRGLRGRGSGVWVCLSSPKRPLGRELNAYISA